MTELVKWVVQWLTLGPLKGYRTQVLAGLLGLLAASRALGWLQAIDQPTYDAITTALTAGIGLTAAFKKPT